MSELVPRHSYLPAEIRKQPTFRSLAIRVATLTASALSLCEGLWALRRQMEQDADANDHLAELCAQAEVEPKFTQLIHEAGTALRAVATASGEMSTAADDMATASEELADAHQREYRGVYEAVRASGVQQAKPGFYRRSS